MGTHRSTTTNQQVGLRITETCRDASKVAQNDVGEEQNIVDLRSMPSGKQSVIFSLMVRAHDGPTVEKKEGENFQPRTSRRKKVASPHFRCQKNVFHVVKLSQTHKVTSRFTLSK